MTIEVFLTHFPKTLFASDRENRLEQAAAATADPEYHACPGLQGYDPARGYSGLPSRAKRIRLQSWRPGPPAKDERCLGMFRT